MDSFIRRIAQLGDDCLKKKSVRVEEITDEIKADVNEMLNFVVYGDHYGIAYPQLGKNLRLFVVNPKLMPEDYPPVFVNPELRGISQDLYYGKEGCMSLYGHSADNIERYAEIKVEYEDLDGNNYTVNTAPILSVVLQHELNHLDGVLIIDKCSRLQKDLILKKIKKIKKQL